MARKKETEASTAKNKEVKQSDSSRTCVLHRAKKAPSKRRKAKKTKREEEREDEEVDSPCLLLSIPPELRNRIYQLVLVEESYIEINTFPGPKKGAQPAFTRTCRQIRGECLPIFYGLNTFRFNLVEPPSTSDRSRHVSTSSWTSRLRSAIMILTTICI